MGRHSTPFRDAIRLKKVSDGTSEEEIEVMDVLHLCSLVAQ